MIVVSIRCRARLELVITNRWGTCSPNVRDLDAGLINDSTVSRPTLVAMSICTFYSCVECMPCLPFERFRLSKPAARKVMTTLWLGSLCTKQNRALHPRRRTTTVSRHGRIEGTWTRSSTDTIEPTHQNLIVGVYDELFIARIAES